MGSIQIIDPTFRSTPMSGINEVYEFCIFRHILLRLCPQKRCYMSKLQIYTSTANITLKSCRYCRHAWYMRMRNLKTSDRDGNNTVRSQKYAERLARLGKDRGEASDTSLSLCQSIDVINRLIGEQACERVNTWMMDTWVVRWVTECMYGWMNE